MHRLHNLTRRQTLRALACLFLVLLLAAACLFWPVSESRRQRATVLLECREYYRLAAGEDTVYFAGTDSIQGLQGLSLTPEPCESRSYEVGYFTSFSGKITTRKEAFLPAPDYRSLAAEGRGFLLRSAAHLDTLQQVAERQIKELEYFVSTHMKADDGFEEMKSLLEDVRRKQARQDSLKAVVRAIGEQIADAHWERVCSISAYFVPQNRRMRYTCGPLTYGKTTAQTRLTENCLPENASCILNPAFRLSRLEEHADTLATDSLNLPGSRRYMGVVQGPDFRYEGELQAGVPHGLGVWKAANGENYQGHWSGGFRHGEGTLTVVTDSSRISYSGVWAYGYLAGGTAVYADGSRYVGSFHEDRIPDGGGEFYHSDGSMYYGSWAEGERFGFGMNLGADGKVECGSWVEDRFEGERLLYTEDRVYGIDIARYQHLNRRRRPCNISWKYLRITSLGTRSAKRIRGRVNYPVSFVYVKCTEGATVLNRYYKADCREIRKLGIHLGSYHFFSSAPVDKQLAWFFRNNVYKPGDLPPVLDVEPTDAYIRQRWGSDEKMFAEVLKWLKAVEARYGVKPILYVNQMFIRNHLSKASPEIQSYDLWVARYGEFKPYSHLMFWQLSADGRVAGIQSDVDINVFNGSRERFESYIQALKQ